MRLNRVILALIVALCPVIAFGQDRALNRIPQRVDHDPTISNRSEQTTGFWWGADFSLGYSLRFGEPGRANGGFGELDVNAGWRFNEYFMVGPGIGVRYYFPAHHLRAKNSPVGVPIYVGVRGNFMSNLYRKVVPYYAFDIGGTVNDGFMLRPTVGLKFGNIRNALLLGLTYTGQSMKTIDSMGGSKFVSFLSLRVGYEF